MQYFQAVQIGKKRANISQMKLFNAAGFAMLTLTTNKVDGKFAPIGEGELVAVIKTADGYVTVIVDECGFTKTQSKAVEKKEALEIFNKLKAEGLGEYSGQIEIWLEVYPTIQNELKSE